MNHSEPFETDEELEELVRTLLYEDAAGEEFDAARFHQRVMVRLDEDVSPESERVLRADEVDSHEAADAALVEGLPAGWSAALRQASARELAAVASRFSEFPAAVWDRLDRPLDTKRSPAPEFSESLGTLLRADVSTELGRREGDWSAFAAQLDARLDRNHRREAERPLEERAIGALRDEVDRELSEVGPRLEGSFRRQVERRVEQPGPPADSWWSRVRALVRRTLSFDNSGLGLAAAAAAAMLLVVWVSIPGPPSTSRPTGVEPGPSGTVRVEEVSFEGSVAVIPQEGVTVVFLSEAPEV